MIVEEYKIEFTIIKIDDENIKPQESEVLQNEICHLLKKIKS